MVLDVAACADVLNVQVYFFYFFNYYSNWCGVSEESYFSVIISQYFVRCHKLSHSKLLHSWNQYLGIIAAASGSLPASALGASPIIFNMEYINKDSLEMYTCTCIATHPDCLKMACGTQKIANAAFTVDRVKCVAKMMTSPVMCATLGVTKDHCVHMDMQHNAQARSFDYVNKIIISAGRCSSSSWILRLRRAKRLEIPWRRHGPNVPYLI